MSLIICNLQRTIPIRRVPLRKKIEQLRCILGVQQFDLGIICVNNRHIQLLNKTYKGKNIPTDVLSFPFHEVNALVILLLQLSQLVDVSSKSKNTMLVYMYGDSLLMLIYGDG